ncbi:MAG: trypsin-like peptidase domain-containing protein [Eubacteriales bacterium]|nr:trypsin-like peptidase domain-containing protein [Eubacteriales bacterium]
MAMTAEGWTTRHNQMKISSMEGFANVRGGFFGGQKDVCFVRALGVSGDYGREVLRMDGLLRERAAAGQCGYRRVTGLPRLTSVEDAQRYGSAFRQLKDSGLAVTERTAGDGELQRILGKACRQVAALYRETGESVTESMENSFGAKLLYWFDRTEPDLPSSWSPRLSVKLAAQNITKKQEYLFCYMLTLVGTDVLLLQSRGDVDGQMDALGLSRKLALGEFRDVQIPEFSENSELPERTPAAGMEPPPAAARPGGAGNRIPASFLRRPERDCRDAGRRQAAKAPPAAARPSVSAPARSGGTEALRREMESEELARLAASVVMIAIHNGRREVVGTGSGIMIGSGGYILTNHHVASGGRYYSVRIEDEEQTWMTDEIIKYNPVLDLAVIRIDRKLDPLPVYQGEKKLVRGQKVVAIGSPLGMFNSVSDGIISGFRHFENVDMIQFTAPISHGSSGGAVLNLYGEVIGISTAGIDSGQNINLAVGYEWINNFVRGFTK